MGSMKTRSELIRRCWQELWQATFLLLISAVVFDSAQADWPFERGDSTASGYSREVLPEQLEELWQFEADDSGFKSPPVIVGGKVFIGDLDGTFYALRLSDGELLWKKVFEDCGFMSAAAVADGNVYVGDYNGMVRCLDGANGEVLWKYESWAEMYSGPNLVEGKVLLGNEAGELLALDAETGERLWRFEIEDHLRCWPTVINGRVLIAGCDSQLHAVDLETGEKVESLELAAPTGSTPARWENSVLLGTSGGLFYRVEDFDVRWTYQDEMRQENFSASTDGKSVVYTSKGKRVYALDIATGDLKWETKVRTPLESAAIIAGDAIYFGTRRGKLYGLDLATGKQFWEYEAGGDFVSAPAASDGILVVANEDGTVYGFAGEEKSEKESAAND